MLPSNDDIRVFLAVAETLNITRASERLGLTQPTVSISIKRLEEQLKTKLFVREKRGVELTRAGENLRPHFRKLMELWQNTSAALLEQQERVSGRLTIGCHPSVAIYSLPLFMPKLMQSHRDLEIRLEHAPSRAMAELLIDNRIDLAIVVNPPRNPNFCILKLAQDVVTYYAATDLESNDVLVCDPDLIQSQSLLKKSGKLNDLFRRHIYTHNLEVVTSLTASGAGVGIIPGRVVAASNFKNLRPFKFEGRAAPAFTDEICLAYRPDLQKNLAAKTVIQAIKSAFAG